MANFLNILSKKRLRQDEALPTAADDALLPESPRRFVTWNCDGLGARCATEEGRRAIQAFVAARDPDVICLQEVQLRAHCSNPDAKVSSSEHRDRTRPRRGNKEATQEENAMCLLRSFPHYAAHWHLANGRSSGSLVLVHTRCGHEGSGYQVARTFEAAEALLATSINGSSSVRTTHHLEGRVLFLHFASGLRLLATYVPNRGWSRESCAARAAWDARLTRFLCTVRGPSAGDGQINGNSDDFIWCGDLNVAATPADSTHEAFFMRERGGGGKSISSGFGLQPLLPQGDQGMPAFSTNERAAFAEALVAGELTDAWRHLHPIEAWGPNAAADAAAEAAPSLSLPCSSSPSSTPPPASLSSALPWSEQAVVTWRGAQAAAGSALSVARYEKSRSHSGCETASFKWTPS
jgi:exonuclease III